ncbi:MAG: isopentenyl phosphate kinase [Candidatus Hydrothermarchaeales archaeon]
MIILKLGGSLLTDKREKFSVRKGVLERVAKEIKIGAKDGLIIVHGGGSFGHPIATEYKLEKGMKDRNQIIGVALTRKAMGEFNQRVIESLVRHDIPAVAVQPSANIICRDGRISEMDTGVIERFLELGLVPVLYGDVVLDKNRGFCVLSGDQIISYLAEHLEAEKVILCADVDGVFDKNPKEFKDAQLIDKINASNFEEVLSKLKTPSGDVTGGVKGKVLELVRLANRGIESVIINGSIPDRLKGALMGEEVIGTRIEGGAYGKNRF